MRPTSLTSLLGPATLALATTAPAQIESAPDSTPRGRALLVGVSDYPLIELITTEAEYERDFKLEGPARDVERVRTTLIDTLGFDPDAITCLANGDISFEASPPDRASIRAAFEDLAEKAVPGELVLVFLAGHGSQVVDESGDEDDGRDEVFLPADTRRWSGESKSIGNAISDDEVGEWVDAIVATGARVWLIVDACHSGTLLRGGTRTRSRYLAPEALGAPDQGTRSGSSAGARRTAQSLLDEFQGSIVCMYGAAPHEEAPEQPMPDRDGPTHGVFTWHLTEALTQAGAGATYRDVFAAVRGAYRAAGIGTVTPQSYGDLDAPIVEGGRLGCELTLSRDEPSGRLAIDGGRLHRLEPGDVLDVYEPGRVGETGRVLGQVRVTESTLERALVELQGSPPKALATRLAAGDPLPVEIAAGSLEVKLLRVCVVDDAGEPLEVERVDEAVRRHFEQHDAYERRFVLADPDEADVFFERRTDGERTRGRIVPARLGSLSEHEFTLSGSAGSLSSDDLDLVATAIGRVYRADGLRRIGEDPGAGTLPEGVEFVVERVGGGPGPNEPLPIEPGQTISPGTKASVVLRNNTDRRLYVYGYYLGSDLEPSRLFPPSGRKDGALVRPGEKVEISEPNYFNDRTVGVEEFVCFVGDDELSLIPNLMKPQKTAEDDRGGSTRGGRDRGAAAFIEDLTFGVDGSSRTRSGGRTPQGSAWVEVLPVEVRWPATSPPIPEGESSFDGSPHDLLRPKVDALPRGGTFAARRVPSRTASAVDGVYTACGPSVVVVRTRAGHGTGFLVDAERRWILTSHHVVEPGARYDSLGRRTVSILGGSLADDGFMEVAPESAEAIVLHTDERRDLALLEVVGSPSWLEESAAVTIADESPPGPGATCAILGHPSSDMLWTLRGGRTAADGRAPHDLVEQAFARPDVSTADAERILRSLTDDAGVRILVTDCAASPGDSGGPLVDAAGRLLGVTILVAADLRDDERSYYVHVDEVRAFLAEARTAVRRSSAPTPRTPRIGSATIRPSFAQPESSGKRTVFSVSATDRSEIALHFDLNGDPDKTTALDASAGRDRGWREDPSLDDTSGFELVLAYTPFERTAFYDTDVDGKFDLVLIDDDEDPGADARFDRLADGTWSFHEVGGEDWLEISKRLRKAHEGPPDQPAPSYEETLERVARALGVL